MSLSRPKTSRSSREPLVMNTSMPPSTSVFYTNNSDSFSGSVPKTSSLLSDNLVGTSFHNTVGTYLPFSARARSSSNRERDVESLKRLNASHDFLNQPHRLKDSDDITGNAPPSSLKSLGGEQNSGPWQSIVRSKSSFSIHVLNAFNQTVASPLERELMRKGSSIKPTTLKCTTSANNSDGFLKDAEMNGFAGIWNHPITRCYFLMYLIYAGQANIFFFRNEAIAFRQEFANLIPTVRKQNALRLYSTYLKKGAILPINFSKSSEANGALIAVNAVKATLDQFEANTFDDIAYITLRELGEIYEGAYIPGHSAEDQIPYNEKDPHVIARYWSQDLARLKEEKLKFGESAFYQAMQSDLRGIKYPTFENYKRASERMVDISTLYIEDELVWDKIILCLESIGADCESIRSKYELQRMKERQVSAQKVKGNISMEELLSSPAQSSVAAGAKGDWKKASTFQLSAASTISSQHTFVQSFDPHFCELCLKKAQEDSNNLYRCESCGYKCHKFCRNAVKVSCQTSKQDKHGDLGFSDSSNFTAVSPGESSKYSQNIEKIKRIQEKINATQKELDIEVRIRDGLSKITKAKVGLLKRHVKGLDHDISAQIDTSTKKLDILNNELQKCQILLDSLQASLSSSQKESESAIQMADPVQVNEYLFLIIQLLPEKVSIAKTESVKLLIIDMALKTETPKLMAITESTTGKQLISGAIEIYGLDTTPEECHLKYKSGEEEIFCRLDEQLTTSISDLSKSTIVLYCKIENKVGVLPVIKRNVSESLLAMKETMIESAGSLFTMREGGVSNRFSVRLEKVSIVVEETLTNKKQREVYMEIWETEQGYLSSLRSIVLVFLIPLRESALVSEEDLMTVFFNIEKILQLHEDLTAKLEACGDNLVQSMRAFDSEIHRFEIYELYCGNQSKARRVLNRLKNDANVLKFIAACETEPSLKKLALPDLLVKPMHRVTRYPLLFKRMLSYTKQHSQDYELVDSLISKFESCVFIINESVRKTESLARINFVEENLDFGGICERFKIADGQRELVSEKNFTYYKKSTTGTLDVVVILFTDLLLICRVKRADSFVLMKLPLPYESVVFLDKPGVEGMKKMFQIIHLGQEIHSLQASSVYDKNSWLQEAETLRAGFCTLFYECEVSRGHRYEERHIQQTMENESSNIGANIRRRVTARVREKVSLASTPDSARSEGSKSFASFARSTSGGAIALPTTSGAIQTSQSMRSSGEISLEDSADVDEESTYQQIFKTSTKAKSPVLSESPPSSIFGKSTRKEKLFEVLSGKKQDRSTSAGFFGQVAKLSTGGSRTNLAVKVADSSSNTSTILESKQSGASNSSKEWGSIIKRKTSHKNRSGSAQSIISASVMEDSTPITASDFDSAFGKQHK